MISKINNPEVNQFIQEHINDDSVELALKTDEFPNLPTREIAGRAEICLISEILYAT